jgi:hypothetical protein
MNYRRVNGVFEGGPRGVNEGDTNGYKVDRDEN